MSVLKSLLCTLFATLIPFMATEAAEAKGKQIYAVYWRGCEESCLGFKDYLEKHLPGTELIIRDAARQRERLAEFLAEARAIQPDLILSWGTSVSLALAGRMSELDDDRFNHEIPQIFTIVADPVGAGIVNSLDYSGRPNLTGTLNRVPERVNINAMRTYLPSFKRLGLIYNTNEPNSVLKKEELAELAPTMGIELVALELALDEEGQPVANDIPEKIKALKRSAVDFLYLGSSSFLDTHRDLLAASALQQEIPLFSPYERLVRESSALMSVSARYYDVGQLAGELAREILIEKIPPGDIPIKRMKNFAYVVNMETARKLGIFPSVEMLQFIETVND